TRSATKSHRSVRSSSRATGRIRMVVAVKKGGAKNLRSFMTSCTVELIFVKAVSQSEHRASKSSLTDMVQQHSEVTFVLLKHCSRYALSSLKIAPSSQAFYTLPSVILRHYKYRDVAVAKNQNNKSVSEPPSSHAPLKVKSRQRRG